MQHEEKKKALFDCLNAAERDLQGSTILQQQKRDEISRNRLEQNRRSSEVRIEKYKKKDSIFKTPELPINKCLRARQRPDHEKNPQKYKYYSLADVTDNSDRMNTSAAFNFLREMEDRKVKEGKESNESSESNKIVFKNSTRLKLRGTAADEEDLQKRDVIRGNKFIMKEYVVGEKKQKNREKKMSKVGPSSSSANSSLRLSHLNEEEEEEDD